MKVLILGFSNNIVNENSFIPNKKGLTMLCIEVCENRIKELLSIYGDRQFEMAKKTGLSKSAITRFVNGENIPNQESIDKIAKAYNVNPAWLMGYDVDMEKKSNKEIIKMLNMLTESDKDFVIKTIRYLAERG